MDAEEKKDGKIPQTTPAQKTTCSRQEAHPLSSKIIQQNLHFRRVRMLDVKQNIGQPNGLLHKDDQASEKTAF
ncbi:hypothetical protein ES703_69081 [subsurface metagenome]